LLSAGFFTAASNPASNSRSGSPSAKVTICHFEGHQGALSGDFVTNNSNTNPGGQPACASLGGNAITVAPSACWNGHHAVARYTVRVSGRGLVLLTCDEGDAQVD
jgi:hypothetical protein